MTNTYAPAGFRAPEDHAIVVGINAYAADIPSLAGCVNDATLFKRWLTAADGGGLDPAHVHTILAPAPHSWRPVRQEIEDIIRGFYRQQQQTLRKCGRRLYLFFAGHGVTPPYPLHEDYGLILGDADLLSLRALLGRTAAKRVRDAVLFDEVVLFMDCCHQVSGNVMAFSELPELAQPGLASRIPYLQGFAAEWNATAAERILPDPFDPATAPSLVQGVFTHTLLRGLLSAADERGEVTAESLERYVVEAVQELLPASDNQHPHFMYSPGLPLIRFGPTRRVQLEVATAQVAEVVLRDGSTLSELKRSAQPNGSGLHVFQVEPARYVVDVLDDQRNVMVRQQVQVLWETLRVNL